MYSCEDNCIEWLRGQNIVTVTLSYGRLKNKVLKLAEEFPEEVQIVANNEDGSIMAHLPLKYIKITHPKVVSENTLERLKAGRIKNSSIVNENDTDLDELEDEV